MGKNNPKKTMNMTVSSSHFGGPVTVMTLKRNKIDNVKKKFASLSKLVYTSNQLVF